MVETPVVRRTLLRCIRRFGLQKSDNVRSTAVLVPETRNTGSHEGRLALTSTEVNEGQAHGVPPPESGHDAAGVDLGIHYVWGNQYDDSDYSLTVPSGRCPRVNGV